MTMHISSQFQCISILQEQIYTMGVTAKVIIGKTDAERLTTT